MFWIRQIFPNDSIPAGMATLALAIVLGLALGAIRFRGFRLGISGVLFAALLLGQLGFNVQQNVLQFLSDFGLIIFVYAIGLQVGPGFLASFKSGGWLLNVLALATVALGAALTAALAHWVHYPHPHASSVGMYAGAFTTTPGLAAGQDALRQARATPHMLSITNLAYAVTYPFGIVGPMLAIVLLRRIFRVNLPHELAQLAAQEHERRPPLEMITLEVTNSAHAGLPLRHHPLLKDKSIVFTRLLRDHQVSVPTAHTLVQSGDVFRATGPRAELADLVASLGRISNTRFTDDYGDIKRADLVVTRTQVLRRTLRELNFTHRAGVAIARINRAGVDLATRADLTLHFGDQVVAVGPDSGLKIVEAELGNSPDTLNRPQLIPIFLGIVLGVLVGSIPLRIPGLHVPMRIGMAGGPMLVAIALAQLGNVGAVVWYLPIAANTLFRDFGLAVFLACVGLAAGDHFLQQALAGHGLTYLAWGLVITMIPVLLVACVARWICKMNFLTLSGWIAGAMTSSPALLFAEELAPGSDAPALAYAAVAPLAMLAPILCAQIMVAFLG